MNPAKPVVQAIKKRCVIIKEKGMAPVVKRPMGNTHGDQIVLLKELVELYGDAELIAVELTHDDELWCSSGIELIAIDVAEKKVIEWELLKQLYDSVEKYHHQPSGHYKHAAKQSYARLAEYYERPTPFKEKII